MKEQKDIFDLFRESQHKLAERPSRRTWQRLERSLDRRKQKRQTQQSRMIAMAAALLLLVVFSFLFSTLLPTKAANSIASLQGPIALEDLEYNNNDGDAQKVVEFTRHLNDRMSNPIAEGAPEKKLVLSPFSAFSVVDSFISTVNRINIRPTDTINRWKERSLKSMFKWMVGSWKARDSRLTNVEEWVMRDSQTLEGIGFLIREGDTTFAENMTISRGDSGIYLVTALDTGQMPVHYKLTGWNPNQATFENKLIRFPQQVILQQQGENHFTTTYQNKEPATVPRSQLKYIQYRNALRNKQAVRKMVRQE